MSDLHRHLIENAARNLDEFRLESVPDAGRGSANDVRVQRAKDNLATWLELHPEHETPEPPAETSLMQGPRPGGWLAHGRTDSRPYWRAPLWLGLSPPERAELLPTLAGVTVPVILRSSKPGWPPSYDGTENVPRTVRLLRQIKDAGGKVILFGASDYDAKKIGADATMDGLVAVSVSAVGYIDAACPGIEMNEWTDRREWDDMAVEFHEALLGDIDLWCHFGPELYYRPKGYDGILWQDKDLGHDGSIRSAFVRKAYLLNNDIRPGGFMDDRTVGSPARSAKQAGFGFSYFEAGVPVEMSESFTDECIEAAMEALRQLQMPENHG